MKKALISTIEPINNYDGTSGFRVAQVEPIGSEFPVASDLYWTDCADDVVADFFYFDTASQTILPVPVQPIKAATNQPVTSGTTIL
jgi:hypothetical protein